MSSQSENNQTSEHLKTIRLSLPKTIATNVKQMRLVGNDLILYVPETDVENVTESFTSRDFDLVEREYKLHVSANTEQEFENMVSIPRGCVNGRHIYTVTVNSQAKYDELINSSVPECTFKPFRFRFSKSSNMNQDDDGSDTKDQVNSNQEGWTPVAKSKVSKQQPRQYQDGDRRQDGDRQQNRPYQDRRPDGRQDGDRQQNRPYQDRRPDGRQDGRQGGDRRQDGDRRQGGDRRQYGQQSNSSDRRQPNQSQNRQQGSSQNTNQQSNNA
jgi:hypothetical protein